MAFQSHRVREQFHTTGTPLAQSGELINLIGNWSVAVKQPYGKTKMQDDIREILARNGRLAIPVEDLSDDADLFAAGLDSLAIVNVLMSIEERFDIELPDEMLSRRSFSSIATITRVVADLTERPVNT